MAESKETKFRPFAIVVENSAAKWEEVYSAPPGDRRGRPEYSGDPVKWGDAIVKFFNRTLRPHEKARRFVRAYFLDEVNRDGK